MTVKRGGMVLGYGPSCARIVFPTAESSRTATIKPKRRDTATADLFDTEAQTEDAHA